jgi:Fe2+ or Zn2+ uptake regulation protein
MRLTPYSASPTSLKARKLPTRVTAGRLPNRSSKERNITDIIHTLNQKNHKTNYRETVYLQLEKLVDSGLVEKEYDVGDKRLIYYLSVGEITINLENLKIKSVEGKGRID